MDISNQPNVSQEQLNPHNLEMEVEMIDHKYGVDHGDTTKVDTGTATSQLGAPISFCQVIVTSS